MGADFNQLGKERDLQRAAKESDTRRAAGAALEADDALDRLHVAEAPELEVLFDVDQLFAHVVLGPIRLRVLVHRLEHLHDARMHRIRLRPVALDALRRHRESAAREVAQVLVVQARRFEELFEVAGLLGIEAMQLHALGALVTEQELNGPELERLQPGRRSEHAAELGIFGRRERLEHRPLLEELALHLLYAREDLEAGLQAIAAHVGDGGGELVDHQLHPQLGHLVLHDEQHLVVVQRARALGGQELLEAEVAAIRRVGGELGNDARIILRRRHGPYNAIPMLKLCGFHISNYFNKARIAMLEKGIDFELDPTCRPSQDEAFLARTPMGKIPFLELDGGAQLSESQVICEYLEDAYPQKPLYPRDPLERARVRELISFMELHMELQARRLYGQVFFGRQPDEALKQAVEKDLAKGIRAFRMRAKFDPYVAGSELTLADCAAAAHLPLISLATRLAYGQDLLESMPQVKPYLKMVGERPAFRKVQDD